MSPAFSVDGCLRHLSSPGDDADGDAVGQRVVPARGDAVCLEEYSGAQGLGEVCGDQASHGDQRNRVDPVVRGVLDLEDDGGGSFEDCGDLDVGVGRRGPVDYQSDRSPAIGQDGGRKAA